jgi:hypothetical protein
MGAQLNKLKLRKRRFGPTMQKIIVILGAGFSLTLTHRPDQSFRVLNLAAKEWSKINRRALYEAIRKLYQSKMVGYKEKSDGTVAIMLNNNGEKKVLEYNLDKLKIKKPKNWDGFWRIIVFDIPEHKKKARDALSAKLKSLGLIPKSVFVYPHHCYDEIQFITEIFEIAPYVRFILAKEIDTALELKHKFGLV